MAGNTVRPATIGVGPALRRARDIGGTTLEEAARDTKLSIEQLEGLEGEDFETLGEEVYVRAMLRTYAQYLGLKPDKVMSAYGKHVDEPEPPMPPAKTGRVEQALAAARIRDNQRFLLIAAPVGAPTPATGVGVLVEASAGVDVTSEQDGGQPQTVSLGPGESVSFLASDRLVLSASDGGAVTIVVNGRDRGVPGVAGRSWSRTFFAPDQAPDTT